MGREIGSLKHVKHPHPCGGDVKGSMELWGTATLPGWGGSPWRDILRLLQCDRSEERGRFA